MNTIQINPADNVIVALSPLAKGTAVAVPGVGEVVAAEDIPQGHKMAVRAIAAGEDVVKYGLPIGHVTGDIQPGQWLHTHNVKTNLSGEVEYAYNPTHPVVEPVEPETFMGFRRADGRAATRNELWIIPTVGCVNEVARAMCEQAQDLVEGSLEGVYYFPHPFGCSQTGADHAQTRRLLVALSRHANAAGVLFLSLGCENCTHQQVLDELGDFDRERVRFLACQDVADEQVEGHKILSELADLAKQAKREPIPASELVIGLKCGGSDGLSGITANPTIGRVSDMVVARGGTSVLTEVPEMFGAESILLDRCESQDVFNAAADMLNGFKDYLSATARSSMRTRAPATRTAALPRSRTRAAAACKRRICPHRRRTAVCRSGYQAWPEHAVRSGQRHGIHHGPDGCRLPRNPVLDRPRHAVWRAGAYTQGIHQPASVRPQGQLDGL